MATVLFFPRGCIMLNMFLLLVSLLLDPTASAAVDRKLDWRQPPSLSDRRPRGLAPRLVTLDDSSCPIANYTQCGSQVPDNLCCPDNSHCMILASNTTIVCCPKGSDCGVIKPIVCNVALQDTLDYPKSPIRTIALNASMETCGSACCPFGYICEDDSKCVLDDNQDDYSYLMEETTIKSFSSTTALSFTSTSMPTPTSASASTSTSVEVVATSEVPNQVLPEPSSITSTAITESSTSDDSSSDDKKDGNMPVGVVAAGTVGGVCVFSALGIFIWLKWFRKRNQPINSTPNTPSEDWGFYYSPRTTRHVHLARRSDDKFAITPSTAGFSFTPILQAPRFRQESDPVELPATPVSLCMWMNLEDASVEEPKLAYVVPARPPGPR
ncbi:hypothetical protein B0J13DRAFT_619759 [Dactylonectria estremocensis]|uniref:Uncharacterized protein n=1 Tax=Dactylonectria estremocensis TaxID=1079267 RepID=A0A9P9F0E0_9HYPO|nr:hypothetical protein B0J13DRAFT_619759 [Dactylonectria estremocensis]